MNLAIFLTASNANQIQEWCDMASSLQQDEVNGAVIVIHHQTLAAQTVANITDPITSKFKVKGALPVHANTSLSNDAQIAAMFARFLLGCYSKFPGPWLIIEDASIPTVPNFMQAALAQHNAFGSPLTGRARYGRGALEPVGPVTIGIPAQKLKFLRFASNESWRKRGQFLFARIGFGEIKDEDYLFHIPESLANLAPVPEPIKIPKLTRDQIPLPPGLGLPSQPEAQPVIEVEEVEDELEDVAKAHEQPEVEVALPQNGWLNQAIEDGAEPLGKQIYENAIQGTLSKKDLLDQVEKLTGKRPHHFTKEETLLETINSFNEA